MAPTTVHKKKPPPFQWLPVKDDLDFLIGSTYCHSRGFLPTPAQVCVRPETTALQHRVCAYEWKYIDEDAIRAEEAAKEQEERAKKGRKGGKAAGKTSTTKSRGGAGSGRGKAKEKPQQKGGKRGGGAGALSQPLVRKQGEAHKLQEARMLRHSKYVREDGTVVRLPQGHPVVYGGYTEQLRSPFSVKIGLPCPHSESAYAGYVRKEDGAFYQM